MKKALLLLGGICWLLFAVGFAFLLLQYVAEGAGLQFYLPAISSGSVLLGLVHVVGLCLATLVSFAIGTGLCAYGVGAKSKTAAKPTPRP